MIPMATLTDMTVAEFNRLPRHPDWKWELLDGELFLNHRPRPIDLIRPVSTDIATASGHAVTLVDAGADQDDVQSFLFDVWRDEEPYRYMDPHHVESVIVAAFQRSWARLVEPVGVWVHDDQGPAGLLLVTGPGRWTGSEHPMLRWLTVRWDARLSGIATAMLAQVMTELNGRGVRAVVSGTSPANRASIQWHWRHGFHPLPDPLARAYSGLAGA